MLSLSLSCFFRLVASGDIPDHRYHRRFSLEKYPVGINLNRKKTVPSFLRCSVSKIACPSVDNSDIISGKGRRWNPVTKSRGPCSSISSRVYCTMRQATSFTSINFPGVPSGATSCIWIPSFIVSKMPRNLASLPCNAHSAAIRSL